MVAKCYLYIMPCFPCTALCCLEWLYEALKGLVAFHGHGQGQVRHRRALLWPFCGLVIALCCALWSFMQEYRFFLAVIDQNSFGLVVIIYMELIGVDLNRNLVGKTVQNSLTTQ